MRHATPIERRHSRPYYKASHEADRLTAIVTVSFLVGILIGTTVTLGFINLSGGY